jgi:hypothetical protein
MPPIALTDQQFAQVMTTSYTIPRPLRGMYLSRVADLLRGRDYGDRDVHRAAVEAMRSVMREPWPQRRPQEREHVSIFPTD